MLALVGERLKRGFDLGSLADRLAGSLARAEASWGDKVKVIGKRLKVPQPRLRPLNMSEALKKIQCQFGRFGQMYVLNEEHEHNMDFAQSYFVVQKHASSYKVFFVAECVL